MNSFRIDLDGRKWAAVDVFETDSELNGFIGNGPDDEPDDAAFLGFRPGEWQQEFPGEEIPDYPARSRSKIHIVPPDPDKCVGLFMFSLERHPASLVAHECLHCLAWMQQLSTGCKQFDFGCSDAAPCEAEENAAFTLERLVDGVISGVARMERRAKRRPMVATA